MRGIRERQRYREMVEQRGLRREGESVRGKGGRQKEKEKQRQIDRETERQRERRQKVTVHLLWYHKNT